MKINARMTFLALLSQERLGIPGRQTVEHDPIMALKLIKPRHHADTPGHKRRGLLSTFCDPRPLKLRKLDP